MSLLYESLKYYRLKHNMQYYRIFASEKMRCKYDSKKKNNELSTSLNRIKEITKIGSVKKGLRTIQSGGNHLKNVVIEIYKGKII